MLLPFQTLQHPISVRGIALHHGFDVRATLCPRVSTGITFRRTDLKDAPLIEARLENVVQTHHATVLQKANARVSTTEHLMAALFGLGITNCEIELHGPELPILDGSAQPWVEAIEEAGIVRLDGTRPFWRLESPVWWEGNGAQILGLPSNDEVLRLSVATAFDHKHLTPQTFDSIISPQVFAREIAPARTFTLENWIVPLQNAGLIRGGSPDNAVIFRESGPSSPPRMTQEQARHKALDLLGDVALLLGEAQFHGHIIAVRSGHGPHRAWMESVVQSGALIKNRFPRS